MLDGAALRRVHDGPAEAAGHAGRAPERPPGPILKNWFRQSSWLVGRIYNDPKRRFPDGTLVHTSTVRWINEEAGLAQTLNTLYLLRNKLR
jgi:hypothetical protein